MTMNAATAKEQGKGAAPNVKISIRSVGMDKPRAWLTAGFEDFRQATAVSLAYGMFWVGLSVAVTAGAFTLGLWHWLLPLVAGFMFIGPLVAVGSYGVSRALEAGRVPNLGDAFGAWKGHAGQLAMMGVMMMIFFLAWIRLATLLFALFFGFEAPSPETLYATLLTTPNGLMMLAVGTAIGAVLAFGAFTISVVAIPTLMDQDLTFMEGIEASIRSVSNNFRPMLLWAAILTGCVLIGVMTFYIGLALILPVLGHASWHAYEDLVRIEPLEDVPS
ncbi:putative membrane protein [Halomonas fontilapidosi]|uniref:Putative membrane protein n=2 Tax=Halomonas fontilapidosi TaxID=616675 RepID=A0A7W5DLK1_9GAMM|nr:putative membrane protein [Halomonas fontilapidosi]